MDHTITISLPDGLEEILAADAAARAVVLGK